MPEEAVTVSVINGTTIVRVKYFGARTGNIQVDSCNVCGVIAHADWPAQTKRAIDIRIASDGKAILTTVLTAVTV
jgi:hypothetical protein